MRSRARFLALGAVAVLLAAPGSLTAPAAAMSATPVPSDEPAVGSVRVIAASGDSLHAEAVRLVAELTTGEKAAAVVMGHIPTTDPGALGDYMRTTGIGGFILMGENIPGDEAALRTITAALTVDPALPPLIAVDQEGGDVSRLPWDAFPSALTLKYDPPEASADAFAGRGALVQRSGIGVNFGLVADVTDDPGMFIFRRALGTTPDDSAARIAAAAEAEGPEAFSTLKHFPGHGAAAGDSHSAIPSTPMSKAEWSAADAVPFRAGIDAGAALLMFGHLAFTAVDPAPASLSAEWHRIAREELGFSGVIATDDLAMLEASGIPEYRDPVANAIAALVAGNDLLLTIQGSDAQTAPRIAAGIAAAVESGAVPAARLDDAAVRVLELRLRVAGDGRGLSPCAGCTPAG